MSMGVNWHPWSGSHESVVQPTPSSQLASQAVASQVGQIVLVVESGCTTEQEIQEALEQLNRNKAISVILNKSLYSQVGGYYGGAYGNYGFNEEK